VAVTPYYWKVNDDSLLEFYKAIGQACSLPMVVYNFPALTEQRLNSRLLQRLAEDVPPLAGIKDTIDSYSHIIDVIMRVKAVHPDFSVVAGIDVYLLGTLFVGGDGLIGSTANFMPKPEIHLYQTFLDKDFDRMVECHRKITMLSQVGAMSVPPVAAFKEAGLAMGCPGTSYVRPPLARVSPEGVERIKKILEEAQE